MLLQHLRITYLYTVHLCLSVQQWLLSFHQCSKTADRLYNVTFFMLRNLSLGKKARIAKERQLIPQSTSKPRVPQCLSPRPHWDPHPLSRKRVCPSPWSQRGGKHAPQGVGGGRVPIRTTGEKPCTLSTLWLIPSALRPNPKKTWCMGPYAVINYPELTTTHLPWALLGNISQSRP